MTSLQYPYKGRKTTCKYSETNTTGVYCKYWNTVTPNDSQAMQSALEFAPLSAAVEASSLNFQLYSSGIFSDTGCGDYLDHSLNVVGWGTEGSTSYWLVRNSWGTAWGEAGYMRMEIVEGTGICGIQIEPRYPITN